MSKSFVNKVSVESTSGRRSAFSPRVSPLWKKYFLVNIVRKLLHKRKPSLSTREFTQERNHTNVVSVGKDLPIDQPLLFIRRIMPLKEKTGHLLFRTEPFKFLKAISPQRSPTNVTSVAKPSAITPSFSSIREFTPERSHISAGSVEKPSDGAPISIDMRGNTIGTNRPSVIKVRRLPMCSQKSSLVRNLFGVKNAGKPLHVKEVF
jgi:hypothetical protein